MTSRKVLGLMSGSSLDGLDMAYCRWEGGDYLLDAAVTVPMPSSMADRLIQFDSCAVDELCCLDRDFAVYMADAVLEWLASQDLPLPDLVVSHGHTLLHEPEAGYSLQIGSGAWLAAQIGVDVLCDLRSLDVAVGGQGAPLAALMDGKLLGQYDYCLNLGGIANVTVNGQALAVASWDLCAANQVLNYFAQQRGLPYDQEGDLARQGKRIEAWYQQLRNDDYYQAPPPKSLDNSWVRQQVIEKAPIDNYPVEDLLHTYVAFMVDEICRQLSDFGPKTGGQMMATGGGAHNTYLMQELSKALVPLGIGLVAVSSDLIDYKEAILMSYIGARYLDGLPTTLPNSTGARQAVSGGALYKAPL